MEPDEDTVFCPTDWSLTNICLTPATDFQLPTSRVHQYRSPLFVFTLIFILVSHREGAKIKVKNMVKIKWNTTRIFILSEHGVIPLYPRRLTDYAIRGLYLTTITSPAA